MAERNFGKERRRRQWIFNLIPTELASLRQKTSIYVSSFCGPWQTVWSEEEECEEVGGGGVRRYVNVAFLWLRET